MKLTNYFFIGALFLSLAFIGCRKKADTIVKIQVTDSATNSSVSGATVTLDASPSTQVNFAKKDVFPFTSTSNSSGEAVFNLNALYELGQAGVAVLDIKASSGTNTGKGVIKVIEEATSYETVFI